MTFTFESLGAEAEVITGYTCHKKLIIRYFICATSRVFFLLLLLIYGEENRFPWWLWNVQALERQGQLPSVGSLMDACFLLVQVSDRRGALAAWSLIWAPKYCRHLGCPKHCQIMPRGTGWCSTLLEQGWGLQVLPFLGQIPLEEKFASGATSL